MTREKKTDKQRTHKGIWWSVGLRSVPWTVWGANEGTSGTSRPSDLCVSFHLDWTEFPRDRRDICTGQMGHVHGMAAVQKRGFPAKLLWGIDFYPVRLLGRVVDLPIRMTNPSPTLDKNLASMGPGILSSIGVGVWRKAPDAFADSNATLDTCQSVILDVYAPLPPLA